MPSLRSCRSRPGSEHPRGPHQFIHSITVELMNLNRVVTWFRCEYRIQGEYCRLSAF